MSGTDTIKSMFDRYVMPTYSPHLALVKGKGTRVWDAEGKVYLDFVSGIAVVNVGHCHPRVVEAIAHQAATLMHVSNLFYTENQALLAGRLSGIGLDGKCFFCNSGAEANEGLIKLARLWGHDSEKFELICMTNSFHGRTLATAAATGQDKVRKGFDPLPEGFYHVDYNDIDMVRAMITDNTVGVLLEAIQGEGGVVPAADGFLRAVRELCDEHDLLMLCDEVQCGMGRTGKWFGYEHAEIKPDAFSTAKALAGGFPMGAVVAGQRLADVFQPGRHATTFGGSPLAAAAALATLDVIEEDGLVARAATTGAAFMQSLNELVAKYDHVVEVRGKGLMVGLELDQPAKPVTSILEEMGLLAIPTATNVIRFLPPLNVKDAEIEEALEMLDDALDVWHEDMAQQTASVAVAEPAAEPAPAEAAMAEPSVEAAVKEPAS